MMSREEFVIDAGQVSSAMEELARGVRCVLKGEHALYLEAELKALAAKLTLAVAIVERHMITEPLAPIHQKPIVVDLSGRKRTNR